MLIVNDFAVAKEAVAVKAISRAVIPGKDDSTSGHRGRDIGGTFKRLLICIAQLATTFERIAGLERRYHNRSGCRVAAIDGTLRAFQNFDLAERALILVELGCIGLEDPIHD